MKPFVVQSSMAERIALAKQRIDRHFNRLALAALHHDLVQLALALNPAASDVVQREQRRLELIAAVETARTPREIEAALSVLPPEQQD